MPRGMISRMREVTRKRRWRAVRALVVGVFMTVLIAQLASFGQDLSNQELRFTKDRTETTSPRYPSQWVPFFEKMNVYELQKKWNGFINLDANLGLDSVAYFYTEYNSDSELLPNRAADLYRYRAGWPFKCLYWDQWKALKPYPSFVTSSNEIFPPYLGFDEAETDRLTMIAGLRTGLKYNSNDRSRKIPIAPIWGGLILNILFWSAAWFFPGAIWRSVRTYRRKRRGLCLACGYAAEDLERCPECGSDHAACSPE